MKRDREEFLILKKGLHHFLTTLKNFNTEKGYHRCLKVFNTENGLYYFLRTLNPKRVGLFWLPMVGGGGRFDPPSLLKSLVMMLFT